MLYIKGVTVRFGFDVLELRKLYGLSRTKQRERPMGCIVYVLERVAIHGNHLGAIIYLHQRGAFSVARFDNPGNAKALTRGTSGKDWLHVFCMYTYR